MKMSFYEQLGIVIPGSVLSLDELVPAALDAVDSGGARIAAALLASPAERFVPIPTDGSA
jgi:hypothetical protein